MPWVVYKRTCREAPGGVVAVCEQGEWEQLEKGQPGAHTLIRAEIAHEGEAEQVARQFAAAAPVARPAPAPRGKSLGDILREAIRPAGANSAEDDGGEGSDETEAA